MKKQEIYYHTFDLGKRKVTLCTYFHVGYRLNVGVSVCIPEDTYSEERGCDIARVRVERSPKVTFICDPEITDRYIIEGILAGVEKSIRRKPGKYIAGYKKKHDCTGNAIVQK